MEKNELLKILNNVNEEEKESTFTKESRILIIDGLNLFFRNFAVINLVNESGVHIGGLSGFLRSLGFLIKNIKPTSVYIVFDGVGGATSRQHLIPEYKTNRNLTRITNWEIFDNLEEEDQAKVDQITRLIHYLRCLPYLIVILVKVNILNNELIG
jgi:5'-3' exonuclease